MQPTRSRIGAAAGTTTSAEEPDVGPLAGVLFEVFLVGFFLAGFILRFENPLHVRLVNIILLPGIAIAGLLLVRGRTVARAPVSVVALLLLAWMIISFGWSVDPVLTFQQILLDVPRYACLCLVVGVMPVERVHRAIYHFFLFAVLWTVGMLLVDPAGATSPPEQDVVTGWRGPFGHKNGLGITCAFALACFATYLPRSLKRTALMLATVVLLIGSQSSTALAALLVLISSALWLTLIIEKLSDRVRAAYMLISVLLSIFAVWLLLASLPAIVGMFGKDITFTGRTKIWTAAWRWIKERPLTGFGYGAVWLTDEAPTPALNREASADVGLRIFHAHNGAIETMLHLGVVGLGLYLALFIACVRKGFRIVRSVPSIGRWIVLSCAAIITASVTEPTFLGAFLAFVLVLYTVGMKASDDIAATDGVIRSPWPRAPARDPRWLNARS
jgi:exopolysaccharide production protein ExoQ